MEYDDINAAEMHASLSVLVGNVCASFDMPEAAGQPAADQTIMQSPCAIVLSGCSTMISHLGNVIHPILPHNEAPVTAKTQQHIAKVQQLDDGT